MQAEVAKLIVDTLNLNLSPESIDPHKPLFGSDSSLGLDSIDALELAYAISKKYGFQLRADNGDNQKIFGSLAALTAYIEQHKH